MTLITRQGKGSKLTIQEMDGNLEYLESLGNDSISEYKLARSPKPSYTTQSIPRPDLVGDAFETGFWDVSNFPFIRLENGELASVYYCQSVLLNGIFIYEAYTLEEGISGYWVAFEQDPNNPKLLNKVAETRMTEQFWDYWYDYTAKDSGDNVVKFVACTRGVNSSTQLFSAITKLTYLNGELTTEDIFFDFDGETAESLYLSLSGEDEVGDSWTSLSPEYILDDDYYGMAIGSQAGWSYYRNTGKKDGIEWNSVGFNVLTGEVRWLTPVSDFINTVTNFDFDSFEEISDFNFVDWVNHPNGITYATVDNNEFNNGNNVNGVTCIWSPYYQNPNEVIYLTSRDYETGEFIVTRGSLSPNAGTWYWDNENFYYWQNGQTYGAYFIVDKYNTNTKEYTTWNIPVFESGTSGWWSWANNNGLMLNYPPDDFQIFGQLRYYYFSNADDYLTLQSNNWYPTNMFSNKSFTTYSILNRNILRVGVQIDEYNGVEF